MLEVCLLFYFSLLSLCQLCPVYIAKEGLSTLIFDAKLNNNTHISSSTIISFLLMAFGRWKTHKWRRCQLVPWSVRQDTPGAQETCGPGIQFRGKCGHTHTRTHTKHSKTQISENLDQRVQHSSIVSVICPGQPC